MFLFQIASCLGSTFSTRLLGIVVDKSREIRASFSDNEMKIESIMNGLEEEGLLEAEDEDTCRFVHDKIQLASYEMIPPEKRNEFKGEIGGILLKSLDEDTLEEVREHLAHVLPIAFQLFISHMFSTVPL